MSITHQYKITTKESESKICAEWFNLEKNMIEQIEIGNNGPVKTYYCDQLCIWDMDSSSEEDI